LENFPSELCRYHRERLEEPSLAPVAREASAVLIAGWATKKLKIVPFSPDGKDFGFIRGKWVHDAVF